MKDPVIIKSNKFGLTLRLDPDLEFEDLVTEICKKFANNKKFFGSASLVLAIEGREISAEEGAIIIEAIELNTDLTIPIIQENQELKDAKMQAKIDKFHLDTIYENAKIIRGNVKNGQRIHADGSVLVIGDLKSNAKIEAAGNVIVLGHVTGKIHAGYPNNASCYIIANQFDVDYVTIGGIKGQPIIQKKWFSRTRKQNEPVAVCVWEGELLSEPLSSGMINHIKGV